jgi:hypothetical protein
MLRVDEGKSSHNPGDRVRVYLFRWEYLRFERPARQTYYPGFQEVLDIDAKIVQKWRLSSWPRDHYSSVTLTLIDKGDRTLVKLAQTGVPVGEKDQVMSGWSAYYWNPMKAAFGFGAGLN